MWDSWFLQGNSRLKALMIALIALIIWYNVCLTAIYAGYRKLQREKDLSKLFRADVSEVVSTNGYVVAEYIWEQQTSACKNLQGLQCWAGRYDLSVVEPFSAGSYLMTPFVPKKPSELKFSDMFDMDDWNAESVKSNSSKLVPWNVFLRLAPRKIIKVFVRFENSNHGHDEKLDLSRPRYLQGCPNMQSWPKEKEALLLKQFSFTVVRKVCINFEFSDTLTLDEFHEAIFGELNSSSVTVLLQEWRNFGGSLRIRVKEDRCHRTHVQDKLQASKMVVHEAEMYAHKYLSSSEQINITDSSYPPYVAIIARMERVQLSFKNRKDIIPFCFEKILSYHNQVVANNSLHKTFLAIDIGKFGSNEIRWQETYLSKEFRNFFPKLYGNEQNIQTWERTLEDVSRLSDAGYVALLQKVIVSKAECVIFIGGGSFQRHTLKLYQLNHQGGNQCVHVIKECTPDKLLVSTIEGL